ncbi:ABC transporter ATP-binding protein [Yoonia sp. R2331]|uniref:ABC transporter ATP-binding protein n=1 Tax=Yoonia sp. R2331 TaxID=3237238 RepID=UPI0034E51DEB
MIELSDITVSFGGVKPIVDLNLTLDGNIQGLIGPNGAGKTTLLNVLSGFVVPVAGAIRMFDQDFGPVRAEDRLKHGITRSFQTPQVATDLSVAENVLVTLDSLHLPRAEAQVRLEETLTLLGLSAQADKMGSALDGFSLRMVEIARCLAAKPRLIMLDEPAAGLAADERAQLMTLLRKLPDMDAQVLIIDHDFDLIGDLCDRVAVLDFGTLVAAGPTRETLANPKVRAAYLGEFEKEDAA